MNIWPGQTEMNTNQVDVAEKHLSGNIFPNIHENETSPSLPSSFRPEEDCDPYLIVSGSILVRPRIV